MIVTNTMKFVGWGAETQVKLSINIFGQQNKNKIVLLEHPQLLKVFQNRIDSSQKPRQMMVTSFPFFFEKTELRKVIVT